MIEVDGKKYKLTKGTMRHQIVVMTSSPKGPKFETDDILTESTFENGVRIMSTGCNGTIVIKPDKVEFGPNCPKGLAVFERLPRYNTEIAILDGVVREFIRLLDIEEESDNGRIFRPNGITSCRAIDGDKMLKCIQEMKRLTENTEDNHE